MKNVIIALTAAACVCAASASFAQQGIVENRGPIGGKAVTVKVEGPIGAIGTERVVTVNNTKFVFRQGSREVVKTVRIWGSSEARNLRVTYEGRPCTFGGLKVEKVGKKNATEERVSTVTILLSGKAKDLAGMSCKAMVTVTGKSAA